MLADSTVRWCLEKFVLGTFSATMDDAADFPCQLLFSHPEMPDSFEEFLNSATTTCTHTHSCNPPGPSAAMHTHTCLHTHTQVFASGGEDDDGREDSTKPRKPLGNREAVRRYREKKKAHAAFLEEEVKKLRAANQQLLRRLQGHAALEAEAVRLRSLLHDVRGKIDAEVEAADCRIDGGTGMSQEIDVPEGLRRSMDVFRAS